MVLWSKCDGGDGSLLDQRTRSEEHTSELQSHSDLVCRLLLEKKKIIETRELIRGLAGDHTIVLSTHILPEVSQTCQRVVIINKGRVVAVDTPDNLTARLRGAETLYVQVDAAGADAGAVLAGVAGVSRVALADQRPGSGAFEVESERGRDVRRELAHAIVSRGWGLLELRPMRMSLEEVFLQ